MRVMVKYPAICFFFVIVSKRVLLGNWYNDALGGVHMNLLESEKKNTKQSSKTAKLNKFRPKPKNQVKALIDKTLVGSRISLYAI